MLGLVREDRDALQQDLDDYSVGPAKQEPVPVLCLAKIPLGRGKPREEKEDVGRAGIVTVEGKQPEPLKRANRLVGIRLAQLVLLPERIVQRLPVGFLRLLVYTVFLQPAPQIAERRPTHELLWQNPAA